MQENRPEGAREPPPTFRDARIARLHAYWSGRRRGRAIPARGDIDPADFAYILGNVALVEVHRDPLRFRCRLHGVNLVSRDGYDMTGRWLHEHPEPEYRAQIDRVYGEVAATARLTYGVRDIVVDGRVRRYETLVLPLGRDGTTVDMILAAQVYLDGAA